VSGNTLHRNFLVAELFQWLQVAKVPRREIITFDIYRP